MTMITPSYLGETIEYSSLHACRSTLEDPTSKTMSLTARQSPETIGIMRRQLLEFMSDQGPGSDDVDSLTGIDPAAFVATAPPDEDQDEGSDD